MDHSDFRLVLLARENARIKVWPQIVYIEATYSFGCVSHYYKEDMLLSNFCKIKPGSKNECIEFDAQVAAAYVNYD